MKSTIAQAESEEIQYRMSKGKGAPKTAMESWTKPRSGWLYVVDPQPESSGSHIWLFDPGTAAVMGSIRTGYQPDIALSPDGSRLYIISGERESGEVAVVNTTDGSVREISFSGRVLYTPWYQTLPPFNSIAISSDGKALRILQQSSFPPERRTHRFGRSTQQTEVSPQPGSKSTIVDRASSCRHRPPANLKSSVPAVTHFIRCVQAPTLD